MKAVNLRNWLQLVTEYPYIVLLAICVVTVAFAWQIPSLHFGTSIYDLSIQDLPETVEYKAFKKEFGSEEVILVVVKTDNVFDPQVYERIAKLSERLSKIEGVRRVLSLSSIKRDMDVTDRWDLNEFQKAIIPVTLLDKNILSKDRKTTVITIILKDIENKNLVIDAVEDELHKEKKPRTLYQIGMPIVSKALADYTQKDFSTLPLITFGLIALALLLFHRYFRGVFIPSGSVLIVLIWTFGLMAWTDTPLSMLTMVVPIFLIAVGTAYCMYILQDYMLTVNTSVSPKEVSYKVFLKIALPTSLAVITTSIGMASLLVNKISAIREFAIFSCFGIISMLIVTLSFLPALFALLPHPKKCRESGLTSKSLLDPLLTRIISLNLHHQKITLLLIAAVSLVGIIGISRIKIETNPVGFFKEDTYVSQRFHDIYKDMAGSFPINVTLNGEEDDFFEDPTNLKRIEEVQQFLESLEGVDKSISFVDYLKLINYVSNNYKPENYVLPQEGFEIRMAINNFKSMLGDDVFKTFMTNNFSKANIMLRTHISSSDDFIETEKAIQKYLAENLPKAYSFQVTGFGIVISQSSHLITEGQIKSLSLTLILIFAMMFLLFLSWKVGFVALLPNCFPIIVSFGVMGWAGIPLSMATSLIAGIAIGLAVDDTIHYLVRYNTEFKKNLDKENALRETIMHLGKPIIFTTITISIGFSVLMASSFKPTATFGLLMVITMFSAIVADLILLPSMMLHMELVTVWDLVRLKLGKDPQEGIPLFDGLSKTQVHYILMAGTIKDFMAGQIVFKKGEFSDSMYAVISGELDVFDEIGTGSSIAGGRTRQLVNQLKSGDVVGEMGLIRACERSATVVATMPVELLQINERMLKRLIWLYPPTAHRFFFNLMRSTCDRLEDATECFVEASIVDSQSGLYTQGFFMEMLEKELVKSQRYNTTMSVCVMELDNFGEINDKHGYMGVNFVFAETGKMLREMCRRSDMLCRYDGDQFAIMMGYNSSQEAKDFCERFREILATHRFAFDGNSLHLTGSFGVVVFDLGKHQEPSDFTEDAIKALQKAKASGGNKVVLAS
jgi:diguanylate cyclase (GGDEF)-like protein